MVIQQDDEIRIKIVGLRVDATDIVRNPFYLELNEIYLTCFSFSLLLELWWTIT